MESSEAGSDSASEEDNASGALQGTRRASHVQAIFFSSEADGTAVSKHSVVCCSHLSGDWWRPGSWFPSPL